MATPISAKGPVQGESNDIRVLEVSLQRALSTANRKNRRLAILAPITLLLIVGVAWEFGVVLLEVPVYLLPRPTTIAEVLFDTPGFYLEHGLRTLQEVAIGYVTAVLITVPLAIAISEFRLVERGIYPILVSSHTIPKSALAPLFIVWFGFGITPKILIVFLISFFPIIISSVVGFKSVELEKLYLASALGLGKRETFFKIQLPHALPSIFGGLKVGITVAVIGAVVAEFVGADGGLGYLLIVANSSLNTTRLFAALICLMVLSTSLFLLVGLAEKLMIPWHVSQRRGSAPSANLGTA